MAFPNVNSKNNLDISCASLPESNNAASSQVSSPVNIELVQKTKLTPEQKQEMMLLGLAPENDADVQKYLTMTPEMKAAQIKQFESVNQPAIQGENHTPTVVTSGDVVEQDTPQASQPSSFLDKVHEELQNLNIDTSSDEWRNKSNQEKMQTVMLAGAKSKYSEEEWNNLTQEQKVDAQQDFLNQKIKEFIPDWDSFSDEKKLSIISEQINLSIVAKAKGMEFRDLIALKKDNPAEFSKITSEYYEENGKFDLLENAKIMAQQEFFVSKKAGDEEYKAYLKENAKTDDRKTKLEYYDKKIKNGESLNVAEQLNFDELDFTRQYRIYCEKNGIPREERFKAKNVQTYLRNKDNKTQYEQNRLDALDEIAKLYGGDLANLTAGENNLKSLNIDFVLDAKGRIDTHNPKNIEMFMKYAEEHGGLKNVIDSLDDYSIYCVSKLFTNSEDNFNKLIAHGTLAKCSEYARLSFFNATNAESSLSAQTWFATDGTCTVYKMLKQNGRSMDGFDEKVAENARTFQKEPAAKLNVTALEIGDEKLVDASTKGTADREDALDVFDLVNSWVNDSDNISDEMKELYAQKSVEYLSPENRDVQAERLRSYGSESFNKGVDTGYENVRTGNTSSNENSSVSQHSENINVNNGVNEYNKFANEINQGYVSIAQVREILNTLGFEERKEFIKTLTPEQLSKLPIRVCEEFPELIKDLVDAGKGLDIINQCDMSTGNKAISLMMNNPKQRKELAAVRPERFSQYTQWVLEESGVVPRSSKAHKPLPKGLIY